MFLPGNNRRGWAAGIPLAWVLRRSPVRHIDDDFRDFVAGYGNTAEEEVANISHNRGAARERDPGDQE